MLSSKHDKDKHSLTNNSIPFRPFADLQLLRTMGRGAGLPIMFIHYHPLTIYTISTTNVTIMIIKRALLSLSCITLS